MRTKPPDPLDPIRLRLSAGDTTLREEALRLRCSTAQLKQRLYGIPIPEPQEVRRAAA